MRTRWGLRFLGLVLLCAAIPTPSAAMPDTTLTGSLWHDQNCDGRRQSSETLHRGTTVYLFAAGDDGTINTADDQAIQQSGVGGGLYYTLGITDLDYALVILARDQPPGMVPGPLHAGADRSRDNDLRADLWATDAFRFNATATVTGIDIGLCTLVQPHRAYLPLTLR